MIKRPRPSSLSERNPRDDRAETYFSSVSRETREKFSIYERLLRHWQKTINLVGPATLDAVWLRHFFDSAQVYELAMRDRPDWENWIDLGSGAGFPGMAIALLAQGAKQNVVLIESDKRKAAFLREVARETAAPAMVYAERIEACLLKLTQEQKIDYISARALASLEQLAIWAKPALDQGAVGLFLKGKDGKSELTPALAKSNLNIEFVESQTEPGAQIVLMRRTDLSD